MSDPSSGKVTGTEGGPSGSTRSQQLVENTRHAIFELDVEGKVESWPLPAHVLYGYEPAAVLESPLDDLFASDEPERPGLADLLREARDGPVETQCWQERADGDRFWATMTVSPIWNDHLHGYVVVSEDATDRREYQQHLERQNDRLKEFTDIIVHDLRNPLQLIEGRLHLARETGDAEHFDAIEGTVDRMAALVEDLLEVARHGELITDSGPTDLATVVDTAWEGTGAGVPGASLRYEALGAVHGDERRLYDLFENLFRNSLDHGGEGVTVRVGRLPDGFFVEDDGQGVAPARRDEVFDHGVTSSEDGHGYGLSIVRTIANAHGWDVRLTSGDDDGARFEFTWVTDGAD
jgi:PAS domain S-box-containing protein